MNVTDQMQQELQGLKERSNLRTLPALIHEGREDIVGGQRMLCLLYTSGIKYLLHGWRHQWQQ